MTNKPDPSKWPVKVLIAAAGRGERFGGSVPKQYQKVAGKAVLKHTIEAFENCPLVDEIFVIINPDDEALFFDVSGGVKNPSPIAGSTSRKRSVYNGLRSLRDGEKNFKILIHDGARLCVKNDDIEAVIHALNDHAAVSLGIRVSDTLRSENGSDIDRAGVWAVQTPQGFHFQTILNAHEKFKDDDNFTDDASLVTLAGGDVQMIEGACTNIKITTQEDVAMAEFLLSGGCEIRTGMGFDVHAFDEVPADSIRLCGIDIPFDKKLKGHSDADVGLHALTDAVLGAIGEGDIGQHFPPSDDQWKGKDSAYFLEEVIKMVVQKGGELVHFDLTLICEAPKIGPVKDKIIKQLQIITGLSSSKINVKATTTEGLGFTGRGEGIAAQAIASVRLPMHDRA